MSFTSSSLLGVPISRSSLGLVFVKYTPHPYPDHGHHSMRLFGSYRVAVFAVVLGALCLGFRGLGFRGLVLKP